MRILILLCCFIAAAPVFSQEIQTVQFPLEVREEVAAESVDQEIKNLQWNRWTSKSFVVCSIDDKQAQYLVANLENIKKWIYERWGFDNYEFPTECRLICVKDPALFEKFFQLKESKVEIRYNEKKEPELMVVFFLLDKPPSVVITTPLTELCLFNIDHKFNIKTPPFLRVGMSKLNGTIPYIKQSFNEMNTSVVNNEPMYFSEALMQTDDEQYNSLSAENKLKFSNNAMAFCLFLRKKYGEDKFLKFYQVCSSTSAENALTKIYGFQKIEETDSLLKDYILDVLYKLKENKLKDSEVQI